MLPSAGVPGGETAERAMNTALKSRSGRRLQECASK
jgi:hypothetical protein